ncbi:endonuclease domain-containing protein [Bacteroidota bacterium]
MFRKKFVDRSMFYNASPEIFKRAKELRGNMTAAERLLWSEISNGKIDGYRFKSQHPIDRFIVDFYCHKARLVIEIDGEVHHEEEQFERDEGRTAELQEFGLGVLRFTNQEVLEDIENVLKIIQQIVSKPHRGASPL